MHPQVYAAVGLDVPTAVAAAAANPQWAQAKRDAAAAAMELLHETGLVGGPTRRLWVRAGLLDG